jgi:hypothetical protein
MIKKILNTLNKQQNVRFYNLFKGVSISFEGNLARIIEDTATFDVHRYQALCMRFERHTLFTGNLFPKPISAFVGGIDLQTNKVLLMNFKYAEGTIGGRTQVRVTPDGPILVKLSNNPRLVGELIEISLGGIGMRIHKNAISNSIQPGNAVTIELVIPLNVSGLYESISLKGVIRNKIEKSNDAYRLGIQTFPEKKSEIIIQHYIARRQSEIIKELKSLYEFEVENFI